MEFKFKSYEIHFFDFIIRKMLMVQLFQFTSTALFHCNLFYTMCSCDSLPD